MLGSGDSIFPRLLGKCWAQKGLEVSIVCHEQAPTYVDDGDVPILPGASSGRAVRALKTLGRTWLRSRSSPAPSGRSVPAPQPLAAVVANSWRASRVAMAQQPDFVFGQEIYQYGLATALCRGLPKILFPWGYDIREYSASPAAFRMVRWSLQQADLVVPPSWEAADHIRRRFQLPDDRVVAVSWGADLEQFKAAGGDTRARILQDHGIPPSSEVVLNVRRGRRDWGFDVALEAFGRLALEWPTTYFMLLGGDGSDGAVAAARVRDIAARSGAPDRFRFFEDQLPLEQMAQLMSVADVFLSLPQFTDMRSLSIMHASASGGTPVLSDQAEMRRMIGDGFRAFLVDAVSVDEVVSAVRTALSSHELRRDIAHANRAYMEKHEDWHRNMDHLLDLIGAVCEKRRHRRAVEGLDTNG